MLMVEQVASAGPPQVLLTVTDVEADQIITIERTTDGRNWMPVRGSGQAMPEGGTWSLNDWSAPLNRRIFYRLEVDGRPVNTTDITPTDNGSSWLQDAFSPQHGVRVRIDQMSPAVYGMDAFRQAAWPQPVIETQVLGASLPVESVGVRSRRGDIPIIVHTETGHDADQLRDLMFQAGPLLIRGTPCELVNNQFIVIPDLREIHLGNPHEIATFTGHARITREPSDAIRIPFWTWEQAQNLVQLALGDNATYEDVHEQTGTATYADVTANPTLLVGGLARHNIGADDA